MAATTAEPKASRAVPYDISRVEGALNVPLGKRQPCASRATAKSATAKLMMVRVIRTVGASEPSCCSLPNAHQHHTDHRDFWRRQECTRRMVFAGRCRDSGLPGMARSTSRRRATCEDQRDDRRCDHRAHTACRFSLHSARFTPVTTSAGPVGSSASFAEFHW